VFATVVSLQVVRCCVSMYCYGHVSYDTVYTDWCVWVLQRSM